MSRKKPSDFLLPRESEWVVRVVDDLLNDEIKLAYADWLDEQGDDRAIFLRCCVTATQSMDPMDFRWAKAMKYPETWVELMGFHWLQGMAKQSVPELKSYFSDTARISWRMECASVLDTVENVPIGRSKIGGHPDLPKSLDWPRATDCRGWGDDLSGVDDLACFLGQINLAEIPAPYLLRHVPTTGMLSFFFYQDLDDESCGTLVKYFSQSADFVRAIPPDVLTDGNELMPARIIDFEAQLELPTASLGHWCQANNFSPEKKYQEVIRCIGGARERSQNFMGVGHRYYPDHPQKPTHVITLPTADGMEVSFRFAEEDLKNGEFDRLIG